MLLFVLRMFGDCKCVVVEVYLSLLTVCTGVQMCVGLLLFSLPV